MSMQIDEKDARRRIEADWLTAGAKNEPEKARFEAAFGWRYGLVFGAALLLAAWVRDAWGLAAASSELAWVRLGLALITIFPLSILAGWLAGRARGMALVKTLLWAGANVLAGFIAVHLPFEASSWVADLLDPSLQGIAAFPYVDAAQFLLGMAILIGVLAAVPTALVQVLATEWAWDRSSADGKMTFASRAMLLLAVPLGLGLGILWDGTANYNLRAPVELSGEVFRVALHTPPNLDIAKMPPREMLIYMAGQPWRGMISGQYTLHLAGYDPKTLQDAQVDAAFGNGLYLRCQVVRLGETMSGCYDLTAQARELMRRFVQTGKASCEGCSVRIENAAARWQATLPPVGDLSQIAVLHHAGRVLTVQATLAPGQKLQCAFVGTDPITIEDCSGP